MKSVNAFLLICLCTFLTVHSQSIERSVILSMSSCETVGGNSYIFNVGEAIIGTDALTIPNLTMGFLQPIDPTKLNVREIILDGVWEHETVALNWTSSQVAHGDIFWVHQVLPNGERRPLEQVQGRSQVEKYASQIALFDLMDLDQDAPHFQVVGVGVEGKFTFSNILSLSPMDPLFSIQVYPVPAFDRLFINPSQSLAAPLEIKMLDATGKQIFSFTPEEKQEVYEVMIDQLSPGIYVLEVKLPTRRWTQKIQVLR
ncbi:MAG: T9SS type A sorting domain-containing protein [Bacteroidota bacterium]